MLPKFSSLSLSLKEMLIRKACNKFLVVYYISN